MLPKLGGRSSFPLFPSVFGPAALHVVDFPEDHKASNCGGGRFQTEETSVPEGGDNSSVAEINEDDIDFDDDISFLSDFSQRGCLIQAVNDIISQSRLAIAARTSTERPEGNPEDGTFDIISRGFEELVGYSRTELRSKELMRLLSPDSWLSFQCESQLNMALATQTGDASMRCVLRRKTGELVATIVTKRAFTISLADHGLQDLHVVLTMHVEEPLEASWPLHHLPGPSSDAAGIAEEAVADLQDLQSEVMTCVMGKVMAKN
ncbi:Setd6 [Symbiodinium natans]|uniref:Setd6 protein n=1 Tax=Symbiodinium natans TaxID=878477 RepID=A0A812RUE5_9DINO|nr:Setd6 [Symbiodinium natans]